MGTEGAPGRGVLASVSEVSGKVGSGVVGAVYQWEALVRHEQVEPRVHIFRREVMGFQVCAVLLLSERWNVVVDTLCCPADMLPVQLYAVKSGRSRPLLVVNTHADWDHVWGNSTFAGHPIVAHRLCLERLRRDGQAEIDRMRRENPGCPPIPLQVPDWVFDGSLSIAGGDLTFQLLDTAGHTEDSVSVHVPELGLLVAGDAVEYPLPRLSQAGLTQRYIRELYRLSALKTRTVIPSHGPVSGPELIQANAHYLRTLLQRVRAAVQARVALEPLLEHLAPEPLLPKGFDLDYEPSVREAHDANIRHIYHELEGKG
jgi:glyoxylase-like metal-dependent hydrolase (beta-lactamase superfamily II)